jgi:S-adenosylmethionine decarboxylase
MGGCKCPSFVLLYSQKGVRKVMDVKEYDTLGTHIIIDCYGLGGNFLNDLNYLNTLLKGSITMTGAKILDTCEYQFEPNGVTIIHMLSESHASIHTYPDKGYLSCDMYTCGENVDTKAGIDFLLDIIKPTQVNGVIIERGNINGLSTSPYTRG